MLYRKWRISYRYSQPRRFVQIFPSKFIVHVEVIRLARRSEPNGSRVPPFREIIKSVVQPNEANDNNKRYRYGDVPSWQTICRLEHRPCKENDSACRWQKEIAVGDGI